MDITNQIVTAESQLVKLLGDYESSFVGYLYGTKFDEVLVLTNDKFKENVNGIPLNSFLIAAGFNPKEFGNTRNINKEIILLRVLEPASLPQDNDYIRTIIEYHQRRTKKEQYPDHTNDGFDPITASELQAGGLKCSILGTFYIDHNHNLRLGSDIENFMSLSNLRAYKPVGDELSKIINHVNPEVLQKAKDEALKSGFKDIPSPINIGTIRYTSTDRLHRANVSQLVSVNIQPTDFLARRTAVLGMTRTGKSNTIKTTVSSVAISALKDSVNIGQLIFDINGEYANATHQDDGSSIYDVFPKNTIRYRAKDTVGFHDLRINFYNNCDQALSLIVELMKNENSIYAGQQDIKNFMESSLDEPERNTDEHVRWKRRIAMFQCVLNKAGYKSVDNFKISIPVSIPIKELLKDVASEENYSKTARKTTLYVSLDKGCQCFVKIRELHYKGILPKSSSGKDWVDADMESYLNILAGMNRSGTRIAGYRALSQYKDFHTTKRSEDIYSEIIHFLDAGKIVILDLSVGPVSIRTTLSEKIARQIFEHQMNKFHDGITPNNVVIYVEEAHNLIGKNDDLTNTWPRIAKEGAKAKIAFVYATQEPSSIHPNILANTENWFVTHLNNDDELKTLAKFYDFKDFIKSLKHAQDVGFARIKTLSSPFVIPTQINRFTPSELKQKIQNIKE